MTDVRENILARIAAILATMPGIQFTARNAVDWPDNRLPVALLFDGDEAATDDNTYPSGLPRLMRMTPEIELIQQANGAGSDLTAMRVDLIRLIVFDAPLAAIHGTNGSVAYDGCRTGFHAGRELQARMAVQFAIQYALEPRRL
jgi:hypothetical protein